eukprot:CAMPEP_0173414418 /NCGR_PEP_ID=MMETSP1356-20130122/84307_1 /TAXON_ID=77927 ORGANISM="Hemiselmis virescens, Strain PCC157" /NCGR_SAMPLE_ID=MMETSP1356 /ASSEMBLY_ACC=CAM_ASM_000847 /LENGTH=540 /DNA_ID=CAMNT_0014376601 /DNA_START=2645 /DNA_END=4267 /DNA_ORIENTATION=+
MTLRDAPTRACLPAPSRPQMTYAAAALPRLAAALGGGPSTRSASSFPSRRFDGDMPTPPRHQPGTSPQLSSRGTPACFSSNGTQLWRRPADADNASLPTAVPAPSQKTFGGDCGKKTRPACRKLRGGTHAARRSRLWPSIKAARAAQRRFVVQPLLEQGAPLRSATPGTSKREGVAACDSAPPSHPLLADLDALQTALCAVKTGIAGLVADHAAVHARLDALELATVNTVAQDALSDDGDALAFVAPTFEQGATTSTTSQATAAAPIEQGALTASTASQETAAAPIEQGALTASTTSQATAVTSTSSQAMTSSAASLGMAEVELVAMERVAMEREQMQTREVTVSNAAVQASPIQRHSAAQACPTQRHSVGCQAEEQRPVQHSFHCQVSEAQLDSLELQPNECLVRCGCCGLDWIAIFGGSYTCKACLADCKVGDKFGNRPRLKYGEFAALIMDPPGPPPASFAQRYSTLGVNLSVPLRDFMTSADPPVDRPYKRGYVWVSMSDSVCQTVDPAGGAVDSWSTISLSSASSRCASPPPWPP